MTVSAPNAKLAAAFEADFVIVGAGAAGCVLASRLSEDGRHRVAVLEAGDSDNNRNIRIPAGSIKAIRDPHLNWGYVTAPGPGIDDRQLDYPRGRVLGGSSSINGHLYVRGQAADYDGWAQRGCRGWSWQEVLPYFRRAESRRGGDDATRGREGPLRIVDPREVHPLTEAFIDTAEQLGLPINPDYNSGDQEGAAIYQNMMRNGRRWSAADAYLKPALSRSNLRAISGFMVESIAFEGRRAVGVWCRVGQRSRLILANRAVILAAGAINSPQLLQLSGIGPPEWLRAAGLDVLLARDEVGAGLSDHYAVRFAARVKGMRTLNERAHGLPLAWEVMRYVVSKTGLLTTAPSHGAAFARSRSELKTPDLQFMFAPASYNDGRVGAAELERAPGMTCGVYQLRPESRGWVRVQSPDPWAAPEIQPNFLACESDQQVLLAGMKMARRFFATEPLSFYVDTESFPGPDCDSDADLMAFARATGNTGYHPVGSCRMGSDAEAVVDPELRVNGIDRLYVADASVMPTMVSGNTYAASNMIAEKAADMIMRNA